MFIKQYAHPVACYLRKASLVLLLSVTVLGIGDAKGKQNNYEDIANKKSDFNGLYFGLTSGLDFDQNHVDFNGTKILDGSPLALNSNFLSRSISGGPVLGYGTFIKDIYAGIESTLEFSENKSNNSSNMTGDINVDSKFYLRKKDTISVSANIGKKIDNNTLLYGKAGLISNRYILRSHITTEELGIKAIPSSFSKSARTLQPMVGIGLERKIMKLSSSINIYAGAEYKKIIAKSRKINVVSTDVKGTGNIKVSSDSISLRILLRR